MSTGGQGRVILCLHRIRTASRPTLAHPRAPGHIAGLVARRSFLKQVAWLGAAGGAAWLLRDQVLWRAPRATFEPGAQTSGWLTFAAWRQPLVTLDVTVGKTPVRALLDSGAQYSVIDASLAQVLGLPRLGVPILAHGAGGDAQLGRGVGLDVQLGDLRIENLRAAVLDLGPITGAAGLSTPLILGQDVLGEVMADIDFPARRVRFCPPGQTLPPQGAVAAATRRKGRALMVEVLVEGAALEVLLDTGASSALALASDVAEAVGLMDGRAARPAATIVLGGVTQSRIVRARSLVMAGLPFGAVDVHVFAQRRLPGFPKGLLGVEALRTFRVLIDLPAGRMHLSGARAHP
ncbi:retropepsin-like aspartic protease [Phenylobacterium sp.]|uniref:retropepsin-like aspartic protease n=1 Tax=Phenylobacterium sp. TaxID=1871053 RepID=UPI00273360B2|nr:retropepsin-like aspartic protease [Phenylobacterium sp.]MDP3660434.1 retropepsin-like aspartic protease [Phenylobacterium sp.]